ncbi:MAG: acetylglutamate kinase [Chloroflexi bacterium]|nr:acetylglutamate kinase [Chloroflexota bacterium]|tara:strand:+ start:34037 stop:34843 length:807 start_codon:yes stop_codon:yes gene_type:complete
MTSKTNIEKQKKGVIVVKIGGSTLGIGDSTLTDLVELKRFGFNVVVVHGGGKQISEWASKLGIRPEFINGLRRTDIQTMEVAIGVLAGLINTKIVNELNVLGASAVGFSGVSDKLFVGKIKDKKLGLVGEIVECNVKSLIKILKSSIPVISPIAFNIDFLNLEEDGILNVNADTAAGFLAKSLNADKLVFQTDVEGVLDFYGRVIPHMTTSQAKEMIKSGIAKGGMIPKVHACINALSNVSSTHIIDGRINKALLDCIFDKKIGTRII